MSDENELEQASELIDGFTGDQVEAHDKHDEATNAGSEDAVAAARDAQYIEALLFEREGYARYGREDRVAQVDEQLALRGYQEAAEARAAAAPKSARGRGSKPQQTA